MIPDVTLRLDGLRARSPSRSGRIPLAFAAAFLTVTLARIAGHEAERTRVSLVLQSNGEFTLDVSNDPTWLLLRLETFAGDHVPPNITPAQRDARLARLGSVFADRIVLFVDAHEVRATAVEYLPPPTEPANALATLVQALLTVLRRPM